MSSDDKILIVLDNKLYDVTKFANSHPGGREILKDYHNIDATDYFYSIHSTQARKMLKNMPYTDLAPEDKVPDSGYLQMLFKLEKTTNLFKADYFFEAVQMLHTIAFFFLAIKNTYHYNLLPINPKMNKLTLFFFLATLSFIATQTITKQHIIDNFEETIDTTWLPPEYNGEEGEVGEVDSLEHTWPHEELLIRSGETLSPSIHSGENGEDSGEVGESILRDGENGEDSGEVGASLWRVHGEESGGPGETDENDLLFHEVVPGVRSPKSIADELCVFNENCRRTSSFCSEDDNCCYYKNCEDPEAEGCTVYTVCE